MTGSPDVRASPRQVTAHRRILGHAQVTTTRIYTDPTDPLTREAAGLIGKALWPDAGELQPQLQPEAGS